MLIGDNGLTELNGYLVDFIEAVAEVGPKVRLRLLQLKLELFVILIVRSFMYRELTRQVIIVAVTSRRCQVYSNACLTNAMRGHDEGILALSLTTSLVYAKDNILKVTRNSQMETSTMSEPTFPLSGWVVPLVLRNPRRCLHRVS